MTFGLVCGITLLASMVAPAAAIDTVIQPLMGGVRTASVANLTLSTASYAHTDQANNGAMTLSVDDSSATGLGWNVTIQSSAFAYSGAYNGNTIPAANFAITLANAPAFTAGQAIDPTNGPKVPSSNATGTLDVARKVLQANAGYGQGSYSQLLTVSLTIPGQSREGNYTGTLTVSVSSGP